MYFRMKRVLILILVSIFVFSALGEVAGYAASAKQTFVINGKRVVFKHAPIVKSGVLYAPAQELFEKLGFSTQWDAQLGIFSATKSGRALLLKNKQKSILVNETTVMNSAAPYIVRGVLYVPLQKCVELSGYELNFNSRTSSYTVSVKQPIVPAKGFFWKVSKEGHDLYLLGSVHIGTKQLYPLSATIENAFKQADVLSVELDATKLDQKAMQKLILEKAVYTDKTTIKEHISSDLYKKLEKKLTALKLPIAQYKIFKPWFIGSLISNYSQQQIYPEAQADYGIDLYFSKAANKTKKEIAELEGAEKQFDVFNNMSDELQSMFLEGTLTEIPENQKADSNAYKALIDAWKKGDDASIEALIDAMNATELSKQFSDILLNVRNQGMLEKIETYFNDESERTYFVIAGAAHMLGEKGLVQMLSDKGYEVTRQ
jgi:uncharacterized protein